MNTAPSQPPDKDDPAAPNAPFPFPTAERHDAVPPARTVVEEPTEDALDHGIEESFPASDPVSVSVTKAVPTSVDKKGKGGSAGQAARSQMRRS